MNPNPTIESIAEKLRTGRYAPTEYSEMRMTLAGEYAFWAGQYEDILKRKPNVWLAIRRNPECKSDARADREYELTEDGMNEIVIRLKLKTVEKLMSAIKTQLEVMSNEARNNY